MICLLGGCVGSLLSGGQPDNLYRFGASGPMGVSSPAPITPLTILLEKVHFVPEIEGDRMLAAHDGTTRYIKGSRWITSAPSLFTQAMVRSIQVRAPGLRVTTVQGGTGSGYALAITITRFEAQYDDAGMIYPPTIVMEGDAALYGLSDHKVLAQRHMVTRATAERNHAADIVSAFDQATRLLTADVTDWVQSATLSQGPE
jgi:cholesterol transport system auxiliary component